LIGLAAEDDDEDITDVKEEIKDEDIKPSMYVWFVLW
jgi:hypothetical protein